jgi:hypothetical protein
MIMAIAMYVLKKGRRHTVLAFDGRDFIIRRAPAMISFKSMIFDNPLLIFEAVNVHRDVIVVPFLHCLADPDIAYFQQYIGIFHIVEKIHRGFYIDSFKFDVRGDLPVIVLEIALMIPVVYLVVQYSGLCGVIFHQA